MSSILPRNEATVERIVRVLIGLAVISLYFVGPKTAWGWVGLVPLITGAVGSCPLYTLFGFSTCPTPKPTTEA